MGKKKSSLCEAPTGTAISNSNTKSHTTAVTATTTWYAVKSERYDQEYYYNPTTRESTWILPDDDHPHPPAHEYSRQEEHNFDNSNEDFDDNIIEDDPIIYMPRWIRRQTQRLNSTSHKRRQAISWMLAWGFLLSCLCCYVAKSWGMFGQGRGRSIIGDDGKVTGDPFLPSSHLSEGIFHHRTTKSATQQPSTDMTEAWREKETKPTTKSKNEFIKAEEEEVWSMKSETEIYKQTSTADQRDSQSVASEALDQSIVQATEEIEEKDSSKQRGWEPWVFTEESQESHANVEGGNSNGATNESTDEVSLSQSIKEMTQTGDNDVPFTTEIGDSDGEEYSIPVSNSMVVEQTQNLSDDTEKYFVGHPDDKQRGENLQLGNSADRKLSSSADSFDVAEPVEKETEGIQAGFGPATNLQSGSKLRFGLDDNAADSIKIRPTGNIEIQALRLDDIDFIHQNRGGEVLSYVGVVNGHSVDTDEDVQVVTMTDSYAYHTTDSTNESPNQNANDSADSSQQTTVIEDHQEHTSDRGQRAILSDCKDGDTSTETIKDEVISENVCELRKKKFIIPAENNERPALQPSAAIVDDTDDSYNVQEAHRALSQESDVGVNPLVASLTDTSVPNWNAVEEAARVVSQLGQEVLHKLEAEMDNYGLDVKIGEMFVTVEERENEEKKRPSENRICLHPFSRFLFKRCRMPVG